MTDTSLLQVNKLTRFYGTQCAVAGLDFQIKRGEVVGFLGPNGAGKSTTMQMLSGNLAPSSGEILINGIDLLTSPRQAKAHIGYLPEQPPLYTELSVDEYLWLCARLNRIPRDKQGRAVAQARDRCGLQDVGQRLIAHLSKGYQQRVGIAQAIIHSPEVVILDEPTVGLDPIQIREIRQLIRELGGEHSVILSTHILPEVQAICDRVQIIHRGKQVLSERLDNLGQQSGSLLVQFQATVDLQQLLTLDGVKQVDNLGNNQFRVHHQTEHNPAPALAALAVNQGWGLLELSPQQRSLEEIFVEITSADLDSHVGTPDAA